jgi:hypothetical protein
MITQNNLDIFNLMSRVRALEGNVANINTQLQQLQDPPAQINDINHVLIPWIIELILYLVE